jgi:carbamate kinase
LVQRDGVAIFVGPGGVPVVFDHEGVEHFAGDLADRPSP